MGTDAEEHRYFEGMAVAHVLGGLDESDGQVFRSHLLGCHDCRARVGELRALAHDLADVERDERRVRAAKSIETKRREVTDEDDDDADDTLPSPPPSRLPRLLLVLAVLAIVGLSAWNFVLRSTVGQQEQVVQNLMDAGELRDFGTEVPVNVHVEDVEASIWTDGEHMALLVTGLGDGSGYGVFQRAADGSVVESQPADVTDGRMYLLMPLQEKTRELVLHRRIGTQSQLPGERLLDARVRRTAGAGR